MSKLRPALVIADAGDGDLLLARITTRPSLGLADLFVSDWQGSGLMQPSWVRLAKIALLEGVKVRRTIGSLSPNDAREARKVLLNWFQSAWPPPARDLRGDSVRLA